MLSFHNDPAIKEKYLKRVIRHRELDNIIQGTGWDYGKGCAVGCTLENYDHSRYPIELGLPEWLARLEDIIFENLPNNEAKLWPELFLSAISVGVNLEPVKHKLSILRLNNLIAIQNKSLDDENLTWIHGIVKEVALAIEVVKSCHESELNKNYCDWSAATSAATSASESAWSAAWSAATSAAWPASESARSAAWSARSAAESATSAAWSAAWSATTSAAWSAAESARSAAWSAAWKQEANNLIMLLKDEK